MGDDGLYVVTGASGGLGNAVVREQGAHGKSIRGVNRGESTFRREWRSSEVM